MEGSSGADSFGSFDVASRLILDPANACPSPYITVQPDGSLYIPRTGNVLSGGLNLNWANATVADGNQTVQNWNIVIPRPGGSTCRAWGFAAVLRSPSFTIALPASVNNWLIYNFGVGGDQAWYSDRLGPTDTYRNKYGDSTGPVFAQQNGIAAGTASVTINAAMTVYLRGSGAGNAPNLPINQMSAGRVQWQTWTED